MTIELQTIINKLNSREKGQNIIGTKEFLLELLAILNFDIKLSKDKRHKSNTYFISFKIKEGLDFLDFMYKDSNIYLERKYNLYLQ